MANLTFTAQQEGEDRPEFSKDMVTKLKMSIKKYNDTRRQSRLPTPKAAFKFRTLQMSSYKKTVWVAETTNTQSCIKFDNFSETIICSGTVDERLSQIKIAVQK